MALLTPLSDDEAKTIGAAYGLAVLGARPILAGSVNSNVELRLEGGGRAFLRIFEEQTATTAKGEARLLDHLAARGVPTPCPLRLKDDAEGFIGEHAGKPVAVFPWIEGESLCQATVTEGAARRVGEALARVHTAGASFEGAPGSRFGPEHLAPRIEKLRSMSLPHELSRVVEDLGRKLDGFAGRRPEGPGSGLSHGDLFRDNVLWKGGEIAALLDFESASLESWAFDLMVTLLAWCFGDGLDRALCRAMVQGYESVRPLPHGLYEEGRFAALRFSITRITDFELRPRGSGVFKDYRRFLARDAALEALGPAGLTTFLGVEPSR